MHTVTSPGTTASPDATAGTGSGPVASVGRIAHPVRSLVTRRVIGRGERGMATSEYAVGTVGACGIAGVLYEFANSEFFTNLLQDVVGKVLDLLPF